jgi:hypothetical protein
MEEAVHGLGRDANACIAYGKMQSDNVVPDGFARLYRDPSSHLAAIRELYGVTEEV